MGLTIHYKLKSDAKSTDEARRLVEALRECALILYLAWRGKRASQFWTMPLP